MNRLILSLMFLLASFCPCYAEEDSQEIRVHLTTAESLLPIYIGKIQNKNSTFDLHYLTQLDAIISYDFNYNGSTKVLKSNTDSERLLSLQDPSKAFEIQMWKSDGVNYAIRLQMNGKFLQVTAFNASNGSLKHFSEIAMTGNLNLDRRQIHKLSDAIHQFFFNRDGIADSRILYAYQIKNSRPDGSEWISEIWECDWDGANLRQLTHDASYSVTPVIIPHNSHYTNDHFLYVSYKLGQPKIYLGSLKGGTGKRLIDLRGNQLLPAISPKRDKLAFICDAGGRADLFMQPFNPKNGEMGKPVQLYSCPRATQASPTFSPNGTNIAFVSDKDGGMRIYVIPAIATEKRAQAIMISRQNRENSCPNWSPDGTKLAYSAKTNNIRQIWIYDFASKEEIQLTYGPGNKENPCWAPDSKHIVFNSTDNSNSELYIVNLNQPEAIKISNGPGKKHYPTWGIYTERGSKVGPEPRQSARGSIDPKSVPNIDRLAIVEPRELSRSPGPIFEPRSVYKD